LLNQLAVGGRLIMPVGEPNGAQVLELEERRTALETARRELWPVRFVPLIAS
jgi:protein-L-isoaspartate O-methyltransferase